MTVGQDNTTGYNEQVKISVIIPTYNVSVPILREAVDSILHQTFRDFELIVIDDGSTDGTWDYLQTLDDPRVICFRNEHNLGVTKSRNIGIRAARGKYIAQLDSDDIALPDRLEKQFHFMETHADILMCGAQIRCFGGSDFTSHDSASDNEEYRIKMLFQYPGPAQSTIILNRESVLKHRLLYDESLKYASDYALYADVSRTGKICILDDVLVLSRRHENQITKAHRTEQMKCDQKTQKRLLSLILGEVSDEEVKMHYDYSVGTENCNGIDQKIDEWYRRILVSNKKKNIYDQKKLQCRINTIKFRLIQQAFVKNESYLKRVGLLFRYLPFFEACRKTFQLFCATIRRRIG